ncbi:MAG: pyridoxamine kinase [Lachnospiraceae bacterium]|nr:pyridoxamine kinase [Lachnospiraceae bacterium]
MSIKQMIEGGKLNPGEKLPSKLAMAEHLGASTVTVQNAYQSLLEEGLIRAVPRSGFYVKKQARNVPEESKAPATPGTVKLRKEQVFYPSMKGADHNRQKKIMAINDLTGFGRCSLSAAVPVISAMKVQCCPLPTSIFSNHTGFQSFYYQDFTQNIIPYVNEWHKLGLKFDAIMTGFLGSPDQIELVKNIFCEFDSEGTINVVDPVMGDYGMLYPTYSAEMVEGMKELLKYADITVPNLTEACFLTGTPYKEDHWSIRDLTAVAEKLNLMGPEKVVITGIPQGGFIANLCYEPGKPVHIIRTHKNGTSRSGTGDIFTAIVAAGAVNGEPFEDSVHKASQFIKRCIRKAIEMGLPVTDGVPFEELMHLL